MKTQKEEELLNRRKRLADLYNDEMEYWRNEALANTETLEDRKARLICVNVFHVIITKDIE
jgi:hypothetical protein